MSACLLAAAVEQICVYVFFLSQIVISDSGPVLHQVVAIPLRKYVAVRAVDKILTDAGFITAYHYIVPKASVGPPCILGGV